MSYSCHSSFSIHRLTSLGLFLALAATAPSQDKTRPNLVLEAGEYQLSDLIDRAARYLKRNYLYDLGPDANGGARRAEVSTDPADYSFKLQESVALNPKNCEAFVSQVAYSKGFAMVQTNRSLKVYEFIHMQPTRSGWNQQRIANEAVPMTVQELKDKAQVYLMVATKLTLKHLDAMDMAARLRPFYVSTSSRYESDLTLVAVSENSVLLSGLAPHVSRMVKLLEIADLPAKKQPPTKKAAKAPQKPTKPARD